MYECAVRLLDSMMSSLSQTSDLTDTTTIHIVLANCYLILDLLDTTRMHAYNDYNYTRV